MSALLNVKMNKKSKKNIIYINDEDILDELFEVVNEHKTNNKFDSLNTKKINESLLSNIKNTKSFDNLDEIISKLSTNEEKGKYFEIFSKGYFTLIPSLKNIYKTVYLYDEIPFEIKNRLNLPTKDKGIDGILITKDDKYIALQVKYRSDKEIIPFGELATFPALTFGTKCCFDYGIFFTNCYDVCDELKNNKYINVTYSHFDKCEEEFWSIFREFIQSDKIIDFKKFTPLPHQENKILPLIKKHYETNNYGRIYLPCGTGKTLIGFFTAIDILRCNSLYIVVPSS